MSMRPIQAATKRLLSLTTAVNNMGKLLTQMLRGRVSPDFEELGTGQIGGMTLTPEVFTQVDPTRLRCQTSLNYFRQRD